MYNVPNTGDETNITLYIAMLIIAVIIMIVIGIHGFLNRKKVVVDNDDKEFSYSVGSEEFTTGITLKKDNECDNDKSQFGVTISMDDIEKK